MFDSDSTLPFLAHHDGSATYVSPDAPRAGERVELRLRVRRDLAVERAYVRSAPDGEMCLTAMEVERDDGVNVWWRGAVDVHMPVFRYRFVLRVADAVVTLNARGTTLAEPTDGEDFVLLTDWAAPSWVDGRPFYQIFPDRFRRGDPSLRPAPGSWSELGHSTSTREWGAPPQPWAEAGCLDFYGGDLPGIAEGLDYLQELGVGALFLNPIFPSPSNHRYDIADFGRIDPHLGGDAALAALRTELDRRDMRLILDITPNHVGRRHVWFQAAQASPAALEREFFRFHDDSPDSYECWLGVPTLAKLDYRSARLREAMYGSADAALRRWLEPPYAIDGWRLDVHNMMGRLGATQLGHEVSRELRSALKAQRDDVYLVGEHFWDATSYLQGDGLDGAMNYQGFLFPTRRWLCGVGVGPDFSHAHPGKELGTDLLPTAVMVDQWRRVLAAIPWAVARRQLNHLSTHDTLRMLTALGGDRSLLRLAFALLATFPGVPCIYYGDEVGLEGGPDPDNRRCMPWDPESWDTDLRTWVQRLLHLRQRAPALLEGGFQILHAAGDVVAFQRESPAQRLVFVGARADVTQPTELDMRAAGVADGAVLVDQLGGERYDVAGGRLRLPPLSRGTALLLG